MVLFTSRVAFITSLVSLAKGSPIRDELGGSVHSIQITKSSTNTEMRYFLPKERQRLNSFAEAAVAGNVPATNADNSYYVTVTVGGQTFVRMIVDTGSSNTWVGASTPYSGSGSCSGNFSVTYGSGSVTGKECTDKVTVGGSSVSKQSFGSASRTTGFDDVDGIFGVGPVSLTAGTVTGMNTVPTFLDNLYSQGTINPEVLGVYFKPESGSSTSDQNGELTLGGVDTTKYSGTLTYFPKSTISPYSYYWGITIASITYNTTSLSPSEFSSAIVDTGTTLIYIPTYSYNTFLTTSGGATDPDTGLASWKNKPTGVFAFKIGSTSYTLTPDQYLVPSAQYAPWGLPAGKYYSWISFGGTSGVNLILGQKFLENYYSVYDTTNSRIGFATRA